METIQKSGNSSLSPVRVPETTTGIMEPDPYWSDSDSTDSEYSDRYNDDSD